MKCASVATRNSGISSADSGYCKEEDDGDREGEKERKKNRLDREREKERKKNRLEQIIVHNSWIRDQMWKK